VPYDKGILMGKSLGGFIEDLTDASTEQGNLGRAACITLRLLSRVQGSHPEAYSVLNYPSKIENGSVYESSEFGGFVAALSSSGNTATTVLHREKMNY
jgi:hypothetical protein